VAEDDRPKVVDLSERRLKKQRLQSQEEYIHKLCDRCHDCCPRGEDDARRLAEIQRQIILDLLDGRPPKDEEP
jgi:uncharacterized cysteine cluster protein YcgN (CxxCxxCC family)